MMGKTKEKWYKGQVRAYHPLEWGCCYCVNKVWRECKLLHRVRVGNDCIRKQNVSSSVRSCRGKDN